VLANSMDFFQTDSYYVVCYIGYCSINKYNVIILSQLFLASKSNMPHSYTAFQLVMTLSSAQMHIFHSCGWSAAHNNHNSFMFCVSSRISLWFLCSVSNFEHGFYRDCFLRFKFVPSATPYWQCFCHCRVEVVSMENVTLRKKLDALELNNR